MEAPSDSYCGNQMTGKFFINLNFIFKIILFNYLFILGTMQQKANFEGFTFRGSIDGKFEPEEEV